MLAWIPNKKDTRRKATRWCQRIQVKEEARSWHSRKQNAKDVPVGGEYMNVKKPKLGKGKPNYERRI